MSEYIISNQNYFLTCVVPSIGEERVKDYLEGACDEVIRCKYCKKFRRKGEQLFDDVAERDWCLEFSEWESDWNAVNFRYVDPKDFCSWAERKVDE